MPEYRPGPAARTGQHRDIIIAVTTWYAINPSRVSTRTRTRSRSAAHIIITRIDASEWMRESCRGVYMYHGDMINGAAYQCVNVAKRRQIAAPRYFKRAHRGSISVENPCAPEKTREDYPRFPAVTMQNPPDVPMCKEHTHRNDEEIFQTSNRYFEKFMVRFFIGSIEGRRFSQFFIRFFFQY